MKCLGFGFRSAATKASFENALSQVDPKGATMLAVPSDKSNHAALLAFAAKHGFEILAVDPDELSTQTVLTQSEKVAEKRGVGSVAEAAALAAVGEGAELLGARVVSQDRMATCAVAKSGDAS